MPQMSFEDVVIAEIKAEMARQDMSQSELASRLGWHQTTVSKRLTRATPLRAREIEEISKALGVSINELGWPFQTARRAS